MVQVNQLVTTLKELAGLPWFEHLIILRVRILVVMAPVMLCQSMGPRSWLRAHANLQKEQRLQGAAASWAAGSCHAAGAPSWEAVLLVHISTVGSMAVMPLLCIVVKYICELIVTSKSFDLFLPHGLWWTNRARSQRWNKWKHIEKHVHNKVSQKDWKKTRNHSSCDKRVKQGQPWSWVNLGPFEHKTSILNDYKKRTPGTNFWHWRNSLWTIDSFKTKHVSKKC